MNDSREVIQLLNIIKIKKSHAIGNKKRRAKYHYFKCIDTMEIRSETKNDNVKVLSHALELCIAYELHVYGYLNGDLEACCASSNSFIPSLKI